MRDVSPVIEVERSVLGASMVWPRAAVELHSILRPEMFATEGHGVVWSAIQAAVEGGENPDLIVITEKLRDMGQLQRAGGASGLSELVDFAQSPEVKDHAAIIVRRWRERRILSEFRKAAGKIKAGDDPDTVLANLTALLADGTAGVSSSAPVHVSEIAERVVNDVLKQDTDDDRARALLDVPLIHPCLPLMTGSVYVIAGSTGAGKSALSDQIAIEATRAGWPTLIVGLEMSQWQRAARLIALVGQVGVDLILSRLISRARAGQLVTAEQELGGLPLYLAGRGGASLGDVMASIRRAHLVHKIKLAVVDYLQLIHVPGRGAGREERVSEASRALARLSVELDIAMIVVAQLSRAHEKEKRLPELRDLRESGAIEQDATAVLMLGRKRPDDPKRILLVRKQRFGPLGAVPLEYSGSTLRFSRTEDEAASDATWSWEDRQGGTG